MSDCVFCKIVAKEIVAVIKKETNNLIAFEDIRPKADPHLLIIPKKHFKDISKVDDKVWTEIKDMALELQKDYKLSGFRLVNNLGTSQAVKHLHVHFLGDADLERKL